VTDWREHVRREEQRYRDGESRLPGPEDTDARQKQLTRIANAAYGAGLSALMLGDRELAAEWLERAARKYGDSLDGAPAESWGRYIGAMKAQILSGDWAGAEAEARSTLEAGAAESASAIGRYAGALAELVAGEDEEARRLADDLRIWEGFPAAVGDALATLAAGSDRLGYIQAVEDVLESFEEREEYLEDVPVADTVLVLQALAERRDLAAELESPLLPG
jgi:hypothetical protein